MRTSKLTFAMAAMLFAASSLFGQVTGVYTNAAGTAGADTTAADETKDYVTVGSTMPYSVNPDGALDALRTAAITKSEFEWLIDGAAAALEDTLGAALPETGGWYENPNGNASNIDFTGAYEWSTVGDYLISVRERSVGLIAGGAVCTDMSAVNLPVGVLDRPSVEWDEATGPNAGFTKGICWDGTTHPIQAIDVLLDGTGVWKGSYTVQFASVDDINTPDFTHTVTDSVIVNTAFAFATPHSTANAGTISYNPGLNMYGKYVFEMTNITDHISRKSGVNAIGTDLCGVGEEYTMYLMPTPVTQPVRHIKNVGVAY